MSLTVADILSDLASVTAPSKAGSTGQPKTPQQEGRDSAQPTSEPPDDLPKDNIVGAFATYEQTLWMSNSLKADFRPCQTAGTGGRRSSSS